MVANMAHAPRRVILVQDGIDVTVAGLKDAMGG
jgi:hypothetical protein